MCTPECGVWAPNRQAVENALTIIVIIADVIGLFADIAIILISFVQHKKM